jgi:hypothetical protein
MDAPPIAAPLGSTTLPEMVPLADCATATDVTSNMTKVKYHFFIKLLLNKRPKAPRKDDKRSYPENQRIANLKAIISFSAIGIPNSVANTAHLCDRISPCFSLVSFVRESLTPERYYNPQ